MGIERKNGDGWGNAGREAEQKRGYGVGALEGAQLGFAAVIVAEGAIIA